ncbi:MAG: MurR/RpiR family transcriptional regulator [Firmicutes bacterium]|nr:MurR/RpiR family transcriptional regulator [Bacillota bacterium]
MTTNMDNTLLHLRSVFPTLRPAEQRVARQILKSPDETVHLSITELAKRSQVSDATVVKFCKRLGYKGFQEFKILLAQDVAVKPEPIYGEVEPDDDVVSVKEKIFQANIMALQDTCQVLDGDQLQKAVDALGSAREIHFYGLGASGIVALDAEQKFSRIGMRVNAFIDAHMQITRAVLLQPGDVAVGISYSGETSEIAQALQVAKNAGAVTIAITNFSASTTASLAHIVLLTSSQENIFRSGAISSRIAQLSTIDTLFIAVALVDYERSHAAVEQTREILAKRNLGRL